MKPKMLTFFFFAILLITQVGIQPAFAFNLSSTEGQNLLKAIEIAKEIDNTIGSDLEKMFQDSKFNNYALLNAIAGADASTNYSGTISIDSEALGGDHVWDLNDPTDYIYALNLAHILIHEWKHTRQSNLAIAGAGFQNIFGDHPAEQEAYITGFYWLGNYIQDMLSDLVATNFDIQREDLMRRLDRLSTAIKLMANYIESYNRGYGEIPWAKENADWLKILSDDLDGLWTKLQRGGDLTTEDLDRIRNLKKVFDEYENGKEEKVPDAIKACQQSQNQLENEITPVGELKTATPSPPESPTQTFPIGDTAHANVKIDSNALYQEDLFGIFMPLPEFIIKYKGKPVEGHKIIGGPYVFGPPNQVFKEEVELTIFYDPVEVSDPNEIDIFWWNEKDSRWEKITNGRKVDKDKHCISVKVSHFSIYGVMEPDYSQVGYNPNQLALTTILLLLSGIYILLKHQGKITSAH